MKKGQGLTPLPEREVSGHGQERPRPISVSPSSG